MKYYKLDAGLINAYEDACEADSWQDPFEIYVHTIAPPTNDQAEWLRSLGVRNVLPGHDLFTATVSAEGVDALSEQSWVKALTIARRLFPAEKG